MEKKDIALLTDLPFPLRPYQIEGVKFLSENESVLLADDMGLGKTIQAIVAMKKIYSASGIFRCLVVVPNSLTANWIREFSIWFPEVNVTLLSGDAINRFIQLQRARGIILATYEQVRSAYQQGKKINPFELVVLDEAQKIKNSNSQTTLACHLIKKEKAWLLTGTPLENNTEEIVTVFSFLLRKIIEKGMTSSEIKNNIAPYMLRRLKKDILDELPDLIEQDFYIDLSTQQREQYDKVYSNRKNYSNPLEVITKLKQICNFSEDMLHSSKLERLQDVSQELEGKGEKVIIFSQYVKTLEGIDKNLEHKKKFMYHGGIDKTERAEAIRAFKEHEGPAILMMSLQTGAVGLNLQEASTVILFDRWWNPAVEQQAIARAHRLGRKGTVHAIKFLVRDTIEDRIEELLKEKEGLFDDIVEGAVEIRESLKLNEILDIEK